MLPQRIVEFVQGPYFMEIGTRDEKLFPNGALAFGAVAAADADTVTVFAPDYDNGQCLANLRSNGRIAFAFGHGDAHESYQVKGVYLADRPCTPDENAIQDIYKKKMLVRWKPEVGELMDKLFNSIEYVPSTAITFRVTEIFDQTPGPGAGKRIDF